MTPDPVRSGSVHAGRHTVRWTYRPDPREPFWADVSPVQGVGALLAALSTSGRPGAVAVRAERSYADPAGEPAPDPDGPWARLREDGPTRRIWWPARVEGGSAGLLETADEHTILVSANNEPFRRKLFRLSLLSPLLLAGGVALVHAVAINRDGVTVLLVGASGAGKSTLGLAANAAGWQVLAEDTVFVSTADLAVVPLFVSGAWECRVLDQDRAVIAEVTGSRPAAYDTALPRDHRGRDYLFTHPGPELDRPVAIDTVVFVTRDDGTPDTRARRFGHVLADGPGSTLGAAARLLRLDFADVVAETEKTTEAIVGDLPSRVFRTSGDLAVDVRAFLALLAN